MSITDSLPDGGVVAALRRRLRILLPVGIVVAGILIYVFLVGSAEQATLPPIVERAWPVRVVSADPAPRAPTLSLFGRVESPRLAQVSAAVQADVAEVPAEEGDLVEAGAIVVRLDPREAELLLRQYEADFESISARLEKERVLLELAQNELKRATDLTAEGFQSVSGLERVREQTARQELSVVALEGGLVQSETARDRAALDLSRTRVAAPFQGRVVEVFVAPGERVRPGEPLFTIFDVSRVEVRAQIPSRYLAEVAAASGQTGSFVMDERRFTVTMDRLGGQMQAGRGGVDGLFTIDAGGEDLRVGRTVALTLELAPRPDAVWLPYEALYGSNRVFKVRDRRLVGVEVQHLGEGPGPDGRQGLLVSSPELGAGDQVVVNQLANAIEGLLVEPSGGAD